MSILGLEVKILALPCMPRSWLLPLGLVLMEILSMTCAGMATLKQAM